MNSILNKAIESSGFFVSDNGAITTTTFFASFICDMAVKQEKFIKVSENHYKLNKDEQS